MKRLLGPAVLALVGLLVGVPNALAGETTCSGPLPLTGTQDGNVVVPAGKTCMMVNAHVKGNVKVYGSLDVIQPATIEGNIEGETGHGAVRLVGAVVVKGNVQIKGGQNPIVAGGLFGSSPGARIDGNVLAENNSNQFVATGAQINGSLKVEKSAAGLIGGNSIGGSLSCYGNGLVLPMGASTVGGNKEGQCAADGF